MKSMRACIAAQIAAVLWTAAAAEAQIPKPYPYTGDLHYDGNQYADSYFGWAVPGGWKAQNSAWEMDIVVDETFFESCTTWTNLPDPYDDCPTAGVLENDPSRRSFGIGSYNKNLIQGESAGALYQGKWYFAGGYSASTYPDVTWQEVTLQTCWDARNIWCYQSVQASRLMTGYWRYLETAFQEWDYYSSVYP